MGAITGGQSINCNKSCPGGVRKLWLANKDDIDEITYDTDGSVLTIVMVATKVFYEVQFKKNTKLFEETAVIGADGCNVGWNQAFTGIGQCRDQETRNFLIELANQSCCGIVVIHEEQSGAVQLWGHLDENHASLGDGTVISTGTAITDPNQVTINLVCTTVNEGLSTAFGPGVAGIPV